MPLDVIKAEGSDNSTRANARAQRGISSSSSLGEIAKQLGVANILEGSGQKTVDQVRVNIQLVNARMAHGFSLSINRSLGLPSSIQQLIWSSPLSLLA